MWPGLSPLSSLRSQLCLPRGHGWPSPSFSEQYRRGSARGSAGLGRCAPRRPALTLHLRQSKQEVGPVFTRCHTLRGPVVKKQNETKSHKKVCIKTYFCTTWGLFLHVSNKTPDLEPVWPVPALLSMSPSCPCPQGRLPAARPLPPGCSPAPHPGEGPHLPSRPLTH